MTQVDWVPVWPRRAGFELNRCGQHAADESLRFQVPAAPLGPARADVYFASFNSHRGPNSVVEEVDDDDDDDDLGSLDFTVTGAFDPSPDEFAATQSLPLPSRPPVPPALAEAASLHAAGEPLEAMRRLEAAIKGGEELGEFTLRAWACLFDLLQALGRPAAFEALALAFARRFEKSPPTWKVTAAAQPTARPSSAGQTDIDLRGVLDAGIGNVLKQSMDMATSSAVVCIDLSGLTDADETGARLLMRAMAALKRARRDLLFRSPEHLARILVTKLAPGQREYEAMWLLLLELYQQAGLQESFEETAVQYAVSFEVSPPSWVALPARRVAVSMEKPLSAPTSGGAVLCGQMTGLGASDWRSLDAALTGRSECDIDAHNLVRIDTASARQLLDLLARHQSAGARLRIDGLSPMLAVYFEMLGFAEVVELRLRPI